MEKIYGNPRTQYERFVNAFCKIDGWKYVGKQAVSEKAAEKWKLLKSDENFQQTVSNYIKSAPVSKLKQSTLKFSTRAPSSGSSSKTTDSVVDVVENASLSESPSQMSSDVLDAVEDPKENNPGVFDTRRVAKFMAEYYN